MPIFASHFDDTSGGAVVTTSAFVGYSVSESAFFPNLIIFGILIVFMLPSRSVIIIIPYRCQELLGVSDK